LVERPLFTFDKHGNILECNTQAKKLFQGANVSQLREILFIPNYFLEMTQSSALIQSNQELNWRVDLRLSPDHHARAKLFVTPHQQNESFSAHIDLTPAKSTQETPYFLNDAFVIIYSKDGTILSS
jgi:hypothetical protein